MIKLIVGTIVLGWIFTSTAFAAEEFLNKMITRRELRRSKKLLDEIEKYYEENR